MSSTRYTGFSATIAMALAVSLSARSPQLTEDFNQTIAFPSGGLLELRNFSGDVRLTGTTRRDAVIKAVRRGNREELDHMRFASTASAAASRAASPSLSARTVAAGRQATPLRAAPAAG
jgi:hypothetical protein